MDKRGEGGEGERLHGRRGGQLSSGAGSGRATREAAGLFSWSTATIVLWCRTMRPAMWVSAPGDQAESRCLSKA